MLDAICLIGPVSRCREQLAAFLAVGVDLPILSPPVGVEGAREVIKAKAKRHCKMRALTNCPRLVTTVASDSEYRGPP
jgi:hypothetical protein